MLLATFQLVLSPLYTGCNRLKALLSIIKYINKIQNVIWHIFMYKFNVCLTLEPYNLNIKMNSVFHANGPLISIWQVEYVDSCFHMSCDILQK